MTADMTATGKPTTNEQVWNWLRTVARSQGELYGTVMPGINLTVAEFEEHCGKGSFARFCKWTRSGKRKGGNSPTARASVVLPIEEVYTDEAAIADWRERYGPTCRHVREYGETVLPTDKLHLSYSCIG